MKKLFNWCNENILFLFTLFLLAFIPLYPKLPLVDIKNVWVYIRVEDFVVLLMLLVWFFVTLRKNLTFRTPLTMPIFLFWIIGGIATLHGIMLIFPTVPHVFPNVAMLSYLRRIEYMSVFFIAYSGLKDKRLFSLLVMVVIGTLLTVSLYGVGQRYFSLPAYLTMNEEFAKGIPIQLSALSRVSSTFGGHYDLAAYFVLVIPIAVSLFFAYRKWLVKAMLFALASLGLFVLFLTVSRISLLALFTSLGVVLFVHKKRLFLVAVPLLVVGIVFLVSFSPTLRDRFGSTIKEVDLVVNAKTGQPIGHVKEVTKTYFEDKLVKQEYFTSMLSADTSSPSASLEIPYALVPQRAVVFIAPAAPTGEDLPSGTGYINLPLSPVKERIGEFYYEQKPDPQTGRVKVTMINGDFLHKKVAAYDLSFTTRFQGEWPRAIEAFKRNIFFGSGYGSVSLAVDNSYLRMLGEVGAFGTLAFFAIFVAFGMYVWKALPSVDSRPIRAFTIGLMAGIVGLAVNALFIDVFEASKIAFLLWLLVGSVMALVRTNKKNTFHPLSEITRVATSSYAIIVYLFVVALLLFSPMTRNFFVGDDFTWLRWVHEHKNIVEYFINAGGFFYRPGAKVYFLIMYSLFWLNQTVYHSASLVLHVAVSALVFLLARKLSRSIIVATLAGFLFLVASGYSEAVLWISATGFLFTSFFALVSLLAYASWRETKKSIYFVIALGASVLSMLFHELGIVTPLLLLVYTWAIEERLDIKRLLGDIHHTLLFASIPGYLVLRYLAGSHWFNGDYSYNIFKFPLNAVGNILGYASLPVFGSSSLPVYQVLRSLLRTNWLLAGSAIVIICVVMMWVYKKFAPRVDADERRFLRFSVGFFLVSLLPFLGLGNIASRYGYLASVGIIFLIVWGMKKFFRYAARNGKDIAVAATLLTVGLFFLFHVVQLQEVHGDWHEAGERSQRFFVSIQGFFDERLTRDPLELHFANVPIRHKDAWIFPVGIQDGLWFVFRNPGLTIYTHATKEQALAAVANCSKTQRVYEFTDLGTVTQIEVPCRTQ